MMRLFLFLIFIGTLAAGPASAQDILREDREDDPTAKLLGEDVEPKTVNDYATMYYEDCMATNTNPKLDEYMQTQCACTAAELPKFMELKDMELLFRKKGQDAEYQKTRAFLIGYMPCMYNSVYQFIYDSCYYDQKTRNMLKYDKKVCKCYAHKVADHISASGSNILPMSRGKKTIDVPPNKLADTLNHPIFQEYSQSEFQRCIMIEESGWGKN